MCEGRLDAVFFDEYFRNHLKIDAALVAVDELQRKARSPRPSTLLATCGGVPQLYDVAKRLARQLLGSSTSITIVVVGDSDRVSADKLHQETVQYLSTFSKAHNTTPNVNLSNQNIKITDTKSGSSIDVIVHTIPTNLETKIAEALKNYHAVGSANQPKEVIDYVAEKQYGGDREEVVRESVWMLADENWLKKIGEAVRE
ncbi:MAG: hypothetical protein RMH74_06725 [Candidatus Caldarchaeum sp.]|nr:hypothetical protein [Candidatus Caldarchaeum sp.]